MNSSKQVSMLITMTFVFTMTQTSTAQPLYEVNFFKTTTGTAEELSGYLSALDGAVKTIGGRPVGPRVAIADQFIQNASLPDTARSLDFDLLTFETGKFSRESPIDNFLFPSLHLERQTVMLAQFTQPNTETKKQIAPDTYTKAPLRAVFTMEIQTSPEIVLKTLFDFEAMPEWMPSIKKVRTARNESGEYTDRFCTVTGMGEVHEKIVWVDRNIGFAYQAQPKKMMPMKDHLAIVSVEPNDLGGTTVQWEHYFHWKGVLMPIMMKMMFSRSMNSIATGLKKSLGVPVQSEFQWVKVPAPPRKK